jgi:hypothetical protein
VRRRLLTILSAISLLLCVATVVLWVRSYYVCDQGWITLHAEAKFPGATQIGIWSEFGGLELQISHEGQDYMTGPRTYFGSGSLVHHG